MTNHFSKIALLFHTLKYLKATQLFYQLYYRVFSGRFILKDYCGAVERLTLLNTTYPYGSVRHCDDKFIFNFLNKDVSFDTVIDWNYSAYGKLWTFNLNYFDFLSDENLIDGDKKFLILDYIKGFQSNVIGKASYTISLRGYNWIKYISQTAWEDKKVINHLYAQYQLLYKRFEYHILANHLLENAISMLFAAYFFNDNRFFIKSRKELKKELTEQICSDGCHYERSIMYHCILLGRLLEALFLIKNNAVFQDELFEAFLEEKVALMLGFLDNVKFTNGDIPMVNDAIRGAFPSSDYLLDLAKKVSVTYCSSELSDSGYRKIIKNEYEAVVDVGGISPDYQPGHAHADSLSFELYHKQKPIIVDVGTSTYESNAQRQYERGTTAHNTVTVAGMNQSQVWGGFRVAKRAQVEVKEKGNTISGRITAFEGASVHQRDFLFEENKIVISDSVVGHQSNVVSTARLHFHPDVRIEKCDLEKYNVDGMVFTINGAELVAIEDYQYASSFNHCSLAKCMVIEFRESVTTSIIF